MIRIKFFTQDDYHRHEGLVDFNIAQSGYLLHWGSYNSDTVAFVRDYEGKVYMIAPEWIKYEEDPIGILYSRLSDLFGRVAPVEMIEEMKAILNKYLS